MAKTYKCAKCGDQISSNVYFCSTEEWYLCWKHLNKATFTTELTCPGCGKKVHRIDK